MSIYVALYRSALLCNNIKLTCSWRIPFFLRKRLWEYVQYVFQCSNSPIRPIFHWYGVLKVLSFKNYFLSRMKTVIVKNKCTHKHTKKCFDVQRALLIKGWTKTVMFTQRHYSQGSVQWNIWKRSRTGKERPFQKIFPRWQSCKKNECILVILL